MGTAIKYLHSDLEYPVLHRDIKFGNLLIFRKKNLPNNSEGYFSGSVLKLTDFGASTVVSDLFTTVHSPRTFGWVAEEIQKGQKHTVKSDMFAVGLVCLGILAKSNLREERETLQRKQIYNMIFYFDHCKMIDCFENADSKRKENRR